jgi:hypothetical protein
MTTSTESSIEDDETLPIPRHVLQNLSKQNRTVLHFSSRTIRSYKEKLVLSDIRAVELP